MKILITGANGYIGKCLIRDLSEYDIIAKSRQELDISDKKQVDSFFANNEIDYVIHTATKGGKRTLPDTEKVYETDLAMFDNLAEHSDKFKKMFVFGSGAERTLKPYFYGAAKKEISIKATNYDNVVVLRLYGCFGELEEPQRFFKNNITKYKNNETMEVHNNIQMDFFYDKDIATIIKIYFEDNTLPYDLDLVYSQKHKLGNLAEMINKLGEHRVPIVIGGSNGLDYISPYTLPSEIESKLIGLEEGLNQMYNEC